MDISLLLVNDWALNKLANGNTNQTAKKINTISIQVVYFRENQFIYSA